MLIGIAGKAGSGKDTVGNYLGSKHHFVRTAFAGPLKQMLCSIGINEPAREDKEKIMPEWGFSYRQAAQLLGTEWGRALNPDIWLNIMERRITANIKFGAATVVTDVRFENEADLIRSRGGHIVHLLGRSYKTDNAEHKSETGVIFNAASDILLVNNGTLEQLFKAVDSIINELEKQQ